MGLMDFAGSMLGGQGQGSGPMNVILGLVNEHGGLPGLISQLQRSGLGDQAKSWVGTGENMPLDVEQLQAFLGSGKLQALASQLGMEPGQAANSLADLLPRAVDRMTPTGQLPSEGEDLLGMLKGFLD